MSEIEYVVSFGEHPSIDDCGALREKVVRCRDCEYYREHKWFEVVVGTPLGTDISDVCMLFADGCKVEPNGFCAWAVKRTGAENG